MRISHLRAELPDWDWRAERHGMSWRYVGTKAYAEVIVEAFSVLCGPAEDDFATQWRVTQGTHSEPYALFWIRNAERAGGK